MSPPQQWGQGGGGGYAPPPGGGGFGQPPQGGPPPSGGGAPPGDAPLAKISFSPEDETNIKQTALFMRIAGALAILSSIVSLVGSIGVGLFRGTPIGGNVCFGLLGLGVQVMLGVLLLVSAAAFSKIVSSDGQDQEHLASGLKQLRWYFLIKAILYLLGFLLCCGCIVLSMVFGAAMVALLAGMAGQ